MIMRSYLIIINLVFAFFSTFYIKNRIFKNTIIIINIFLLILVLGSRDLLYGDTKAYVEYYNSLPELSGPRFELLFHNLGVVNKKIGLSERLYIIEILSIYLFGLFFSFRYLSNLLFEKNKELPVFLFLSTFTFYYHSTEALRDGLSMILLLFSLSYFLEGKNLKSIIYIVLSSLFHKFSIVFLSVFFLKNLRVSWLFKLLYFVFAISFVIKDFLIVFFTKLGLDSIVLRLNLYENFGGSKTVLLRDLLLLLLIIVLDLFFQKKDIKIEEERFLKFFLISSMICFSLIIFKEANRRFLFKMTYFIPFLLCIILSYFRKVNRISLIVMIIIFFGLYSNIFLMNYRALVGLLNL